MGEPAPTLPRPRRRWLRWLAAASVLLLAGSLGLWLARKPLLGAALTSALHRAGAGDVKFRIVTASPGRLEFQDLSFRVKTQAFAMSRVTLERPQWWRLTLGRVRLEGVRTTWVVDGSDLNPSDWPKYPEGASSTVSVAVPADEIVLDGTLGIQAATLAEQPVEVRVAARQTSSGEWTASVRAHGTGVDVNADLTGRPEHRRFAVQQGSTVFDLKVWQDFLQRALVFPGGHWTLAGRVSADLAGGYDGRAWTAGGRVRLDGGGFENEGRQLSFHGAEADVEFTDFLHLKSKPGTLRVRELKSGDFVASDLDFALAMAGATRIEVSRAMLHALGGTLSAEPFTYALGKNELEATMLAEGLDLSAILARSGDLPATAVGRVGGRLPVRIDQAGLRFGTGWLGLKSGVRAEIKLRAAGLLTSGVPPSSPSYAVLNKVESGLLRLQVTELRLDVHPPNAPPGRTAQLHLVAEPVDPSVKAPIILDLNVNGPVERFLNLGLDRRANFGAGK